MRPYEMINLLNFFLQNQNKYSLNIFTYLYSKK